MKNNDTIRYVPKDRYTIVYRGDRRLGAVFVDDRRVWVAMGFDQYYYQGSDGAPFRNRNEGIAFILDAHPRSCSSR